MTEENRGTVESVETLIGSVGIILWICNADDLSFSFVNESASRILLYSVQDWLKDPQFWLKHLHREDRDNVVQILRRIAEHGVDTVFQCRIIDADGSEHWMENIVRLDVRSDKKLLHGATIDITSRKRESILRDEADDRQKVENERARTELLQQLRQSQRLEAIGHLAGSAAHDFKNTLMAINGFCDILLIRLAANDPSKREVLGIQRATQQATILAHQLLAFSRKQILAPKAIQLNQILNDMRPILEGLLGEGITFQINPTENLGTIKADAGQIEQVILNMAINARDAMGASGKFTIETSHVYLDEEYASNHLNAVPGWYVQISFSDTGAGMDEATRLRIFEPFFTTKPSGTGLGLSTCFGIVKQSGGEIWVYSEPGKGSTFKIYFPRTDADSNEPGALSNEKTRGGGSETILLVDDNEMVRTATGRMLRIAGYNVVEAPNGDNALREEALHPGPIHLLITDVVMPQMSGRELAAAILEKRTDIRVLYMSGYTADSVRSYGDVDPTQFIAKPVTMRMLLDKVRELLDRR